jgi:very-short-patch-repair endonuclease
MRNRSQKATNQAQLLRKSMSDSERILWGALRNRRQAFRFRRQHAIGSYILDFYCAEANLCIEVDGELHELRRDRDASRDSFLNDLDVETIRIPSWDVYDHLDSTIERILRMCENRINEKQK